jgi:hypothetical protein
MRKGGGTRVASGVTAAVISFVCQGVNGPGGKHSVARHVEGALDAAHRHCRACGRMILTSAALGCSLPNPAAGPAEAQADYTREPVVTGQTASHHETRIIKKTREGSPMPGVGICANQELVSHRGASSRRAEENRARPVPGQGFDRGRNPIDFRPLPQEGGIV